MAVVISSLSAGNRARVAASTRLSASVPPSALSRRETSPIIQLATSLGAPQALAAASKKVPVARFCVIRVAS